MATTTTRPPSPSLDDSSDVCALMDISLDDNFSHCITGQFLTSAFNHMVPRVEYFGGVSPGAIGSNLARSENSMSIQSGVYDLLCLGKLVLVPSDSTLLKILEVAEQNRGLPLTKRVPFNDPQIPEFDPSLCVYSLSVQRYKGTIFTRNPGTGKVTKYTHPYPTLPHITTSANPWLVFAAAYNAVTTGNMGLPLLRRVGTAMLAHEYPDNFEPAWPSLPQSNAFTSELKSNHLASKSSSSGDSDTVAKQETVDARPDSEDVEQVEDTRDFAPTATQDSDRDDKHNVTNAHSDSPLTAVSTQDPPQYLADIPSNGDSEAPVEMTQQSVASPDAETGDNACSTQMESHVATGGQKDASPPTSNDESKIEVVEPVEAIEPVVAPLDVASQNGNSAASAQPEPPTLQDRSPQPASEADASSRLGITAPVVGTTRPQGNSGQSLSTRGTKKRKRTQGTSAEERGSSSDKSSKKKKTRRASEPSPQPLRRAISLSGLALTRCIR